MNWMGCGGACAAGDGNRRAAGDGDRWGAGDGDQRRIFVFFSETMIPHSSHQDIMRQGCLLTHMNLKKKTLKIFCSSPINLSLFQMEKNMYLIK